MAETLVWIDTDSVAHPMSDASAGMAIFWGMRDRFMPRFKFVEEAVPGRPGARHRAVRGEVREVTIPVLFRDTSPAALRATLRTWLGWLDPQRGTGILRVTDDGGAQRELNCRYSGGLEIDESMGQLWGSRQGQKGSVVFRAVDPWWYDVDDTVLSFALASGSAFFPFFPLVLAPSELLDTPTPIDNTGDVEAWPVWTITGPATNPVLSNLTTGKVLELTITLAAAELLTIDTRPGRKAITLDDGSNLFGTRTATSSLWPLVRGSNQLQIELTSATSASRVDLAYRRGYLSA